MNQIANCISQSFQLHISESELFAIVNDQLNEMHHQKTIYTYNFQQFMCMHIRGIVQQVAYIAGYTLSHLPNSAETSVCK